MRRCGAGLFALLLPACGGATRGAVGSDGAADTAAGAGLDAEAAAVADAGSDVGPAEPPPALGPALCALAANPFCLIDPPFRGVWQDRPDDLWLLASDFQEVSARHWDGSAWTAQDTGAGALSALWGSGPRDLWAVGPAGRIVHGDGDRFVPAESGTDATLNAVWGSGADDVWAVGATRGSPARAVTLHWDGASWSTVSSGDGETGADLALRAVGGSGAQDVWAVGERIATADGERSPLAMHWDGGRWTPLVIARPGLGLTAIWSGGPDQVWFAGNGQILRYDGAALESSKDGIAGTVAALWGSGAGDLWAAGSKGTLLHWDGAGWQPAFAGTPHDLGALWGSGAADAWAAGPAGSVVHWDGASWTLIADGSTGPLEALWGSAPQDLWTAGPLHGDGPRWVADANDSFIPVLDICGFAADDLWAVGIALQNGLDVGYVAHRDGSDWTIHGVDGVYLPYTGRDNTLGPSSLRALWCHTPADVWAVGQIEDVVGNVLATTAHWDGSLWSPRPTPSTSFLNGVWGSRADDVWAAGGAGTLLHWDGAVWTAVPSGTSADLGAVWGSGAGDVWVVVQDRAELLHWDGAAWTFIPSGAADPHLSRFWGSGPQDLWAIGGDLTGGVVLHWDGRAWSTIWSAPAAVGRLSGIRGRGSSLWLVAADGLIFSRP